MNLLLFKTSVLCHSRSCDLPFAPDSRAGWLHLPTQDVIVSISAFGRYLSQLSALTKPATATRLKAKEGPLAWR